MQLAERLKVLTDGVCVRAFRLLLDTPGVAATVPMIRGVWGRALQHVDEAVYRQVFVGDGPPHLRVPRYIIRLAPPDAATAPAIEWILIGDETTLSHAVSMSAWNVACRMGLGPGRIPFRIRDIVSLSSQFDVWRLSGAVAPIGGAPDRSPCKLTFSAPLRLIKHGELVLTPGYVDIAVAALRRVATLGGCAQGVDYRDLMRDVRAEASRMPATRWNGERQDLVRWSGRQKRAIDLFGVVGSLGLPDGLGQTWPLLAAAQWAHIGKGTVFGLGLPEISDL